MNRQVSVVYSREILKSAVLRFWLRFIAWHGFLAIILALGIFLYLLITGDRSWLLGVTGSLACFMLFMPAMVYYTYLSRSLARFEQMSSKQVELTITDDQFATKSDLGEGSMHWNSFSKLWRFPKIWLLFYGWNSFVSLPVEQLDEEVKAFIVDRVRSHGGKAI